MKTSPRPKAHKHVDRATLGHTLQKKILKNDIYDFNVSIKQNIWKCRITLSITASFLVMFFLFTQYKTVHCISSAMEVFSCSYLQ